MTRVLITGSAGFIGSGVLQSACTRDWEVSGVDCFFPNYDPAIKRRNLEEVAAASVDNPPVLHELDLTDRPAAGALLRELRPDLVIHLAALAGVRASIEHPLRYGTHNILATMSLLQAMHEAGCTRLVLASSSSVYGTDAPAPFVETQDVDNPVSPYAASKRAAELMARTWHNLYGIDTVICRLFTVYGPRQRPDLAIHRFTARIHAGEPIPVFGDGTSTRDYTHVSDVARGLLAAADHLFENRGVYETVNIGSANPVSLAELIDTVQDACGLEAVIDRKPDQLGDVSHTYADVSRAAALLGWTPEIPFRDGIVDFVDWWRRHHVTEP